MEKYTGEGIDSKGKRKDFLLNWYWGTPFQKEEKPCQISSAEAGDLSVEAAQMGVGGEYTASVCLNCQKGILNSKDGYKTRVSAQHAAEEMLERILRKAAGKIGCRLQSKLVSDRV